MCDHSWVYNVTRTIFHIYLCIMKATLYECMSAFACMWNQWSKSADNAETSVTFVAQVSLSTVGYTQGEPIVPYL